MSMTKNFRIKELLCAAGCLALAACESATPLTRIQANPTLYNSLPEAHQALVQQGQVCRGMSREGVLLAWGEPDSRANGQTPAGAAWERWEYTGFEPVTTVHTGIGGWYGPYCWHPYGGAGMDTAYIPRCRAAVEFVNGAVDKWMHYGR